MEEDACDDERDTVSVWQLEPVCGDLPSPMHQNISFRGKAQDSWSITLGSSP
jgi:hypothetical protein